MSRLLTGRKNTILDYSYIDESNILLLLSESFYLHSQNSTEINYLYDYYRGKQDIQYKTKETREDINNKITENSSYEIVTFKKGYMFGELVQYISRGTDEVITDAIAELNNYMLLNHKVKSDNDLIEWVLIGGVGYRLVLPNEDYFGIEDPPFVARTQDPRFTYLIKSSDLDNSVIAGVTYIKRKQQIVLVNILLNQSTKYLYHSLSIAHLVYKIYHYFIYY